jgi:stage II sporulation protein AB (anti-sigma F factor)
VLDRSYPSAKGSVALARADAAAYAAGSGASEEQVDSIRRAVSEAVANAVAHAYPIDNGRIYVTATRIATELTVMVADDGVGPGRPSSTPGTAVGWSIIADAADLFTVSARGGGGTLVEMRWAMVTVESALAAPTDLGIVRELRARRRRARSSA